MPDHPVPKRDSTRIVMPSVGSGPVLATRTAFFVAGFGLACWAPLVPLAKMRLGVSDGALGALLLCIGLGSVATMQVASPVIARHGTRRAIVVGGVGQALVLPLLGFASDVPAMALALLLFGGFLGLIDVSMNIHAVEVEKRAAIPLMSGFHGLFSVGGLLGSAFLTAALSSGISALAGTLVASALMIAIVVGTARRLLDLRQDREEAWFAIPRGIVVVLAFLAAITFLTEGAMLDWGALLLMERQLLPSAQAGIGYSVFAGAMTVGRLAGDAIVARFGDRDTMLWGGVLAILGYALLLLGSKPSLALLGFLLIGLGASNTVPILFRLAGSQRIMPSSTAIAAVTSIGYAGVLVGPAGIGLAAQTFGLATAFWLLTGLLCLVPLCARVTTSVGQDRDNARGAAPP